VIRLAKGVGLLGISLGVTMHDTLIRPDADETTEERPSVPGLLAAAAWAIGLAVGLGALIAGHPVLAAVAAIMGLMAPWLGLGWIEHTHHRVDGAEPVSVRRSADGPAFPQSSWVAPGV
jgi:hypothetical protein